MPTPENNARFKDTTVTNLVVNDTATINTLKVRQDGDGTTYNTVLFDPRKDFTQPSIDGNFLPTIAQIRDYIEAKQRARIQIYDMSTTTSTGDGVQITSNLTLTDVAPTVGNPGSGIFFRPFLTPSDPNSDSSQAGFYSPAYNEDYYNANKLYPDETSTGNSNLKPYYLTSVNVGTGKSLTVYNQGTLSLAHDASSTSWTVSVSADGNTITFA